MRLLAEILISLLLHPIAVILAMINLIGRSDLMPGKKILWALLIFFAWGLGPLLYIFLGDGALW